MVGNISRDVECRFLKSIAENIVSSRELSYNPELTGFLAIKGHLYTGELMVIGRAVNKWGNIHRYISELDGIENRNEFVKAVVRSVSGNAPMQWVTDQWGNYDEKYNTKTSAFWRVISQVVDQLGVADSNCASWPSHLVWSNLYKVAPAKGGNPGAILISLQQEDCISLLIEEIKIFQPKRLLFLSGFEWARPFVHRLASTITESTGYVEAVANIDGFGRRDSKIVVAQHPQGKQEAKLVEKVIKAFNY